MNFWKIYGFIICETLWEISGSCLWIYDYNLKRYLEVLLFFNMNVHA